MTDEEKALFEFLAGQDRKLDEIKRGQSWWLDLSSNVAGNAIWECATWLLSRIARRL